MYDSPIKKVYIELAQTCNLDCISCFQRNWTDPLRQMDKGLFLDINQQLHLLDSLEHVVIGGIGEPTTHPDFNELMRVLPKVKRSITTNGFNWSDETVHTLVSEFDQIIVSVDGLDETFKTIRTFELDHLRENLKRLVDLRKEKKQLRPHLIAQLVLSKWNIDEVEPLIDELRKMGIMKLIISNLLPQNFASKDLICYTIDSNETMKDYRKKWLNKALSNQMQTKFPHFELKTERKCIFVEDSTVTIVANGQVAPCYRFAHDSIEYVFGRRKVVHSFYYGDTNDNKLVDIYEKKEYKDLRFQNYANRFPSCPDCDLLDACDYVNDSLCDCNGQYPSCADCLWTRGFVECI